MRIGELADLVGISTRAIRHYHRIGLLAEPGGRRGAVDDDGCADLTQGGETTVTVELARPLTFTRPLGKQAQARVFRFYAADPATAVAALRARTPGPCDAAGPPVAAGRLAAADTRPGRAEIGLGKDLKAARIIT